MTSSINPEVTLEVRIALSSVEDRTTATGNMWVYTEFREVLTYGF